MNSVSLEIRNYVLENDSKNEVVVNGPSEQELSEAEKQKLNVSSNFHQTFYGIKEDASKFNFNYRLFLISNEIEQEHIFENMRMKELTNDVILATSGFFGLNITAARPRPDAQTLPYILMIDCSLAVEKFWLQCQEIITKNVNRQTCLKEIKYLLATRASQFWSRNSPYSLQDEINLAVRSLDLDIRENKSWLCTDESFAKIREIFIQNHFIFKRLNFCNKEAMTELANRIVALNLKIDVLYLSNVREYAEREKQLKEFQEGFLALKTAMTDDTVLIDTKPRYGGVSGLQTKLIQRLQFNLLSLDVNKLLPPSLGRKP